MPISKKTFFGLCAMVLLMGCANITNLTPSRYPRNSTGLYRFEAAWESSQASIRPGSLQPKLIIGTESYALQPTPNVSNRWETLAPVPADQQWVSYRYKFDYQYNAIPVPRSNSVLSAPFRLQIVD